ncbi:MAG: MFS transporter [Alphaproteobacteria bacterium]|nr:MFS transporter [Alphaproteobacteria bacterium]
MTAIADEGGFRPVGEALNRRDIRTLMLASLGGALEFYDFIVFVFFAGVLAKLFFPADMPEWLRLTQTYGLFAAGYLARPLGGFVLAHFGDLVGRKRMFVLSVLLMALPTLAIGLMPTFATIGYAAPLILLALRIMQGAAIGGEAPGAWVFLSEHVPAGRIGLACGMLTAGLTLGIMLGSVMSLLINANFAPQAIVDWAWRIPFLVGGVFGLVAMYLRRFLEETPVFEAMRQRAALSHRPPLVQVVTAHQRAVVAGLFATWMLTATIVTVILLAPQFLQTLFRFSALETSLANVVGTLTLTLSCVAVGWSIDRFGLGVMIPVSALAFLVGGYALYGLAGAHRELLVPIYALAGFTSGAVTIVPYMMVRAFPPEVRFSGVSFCYNTAYAISAAATPPLLANLMLQDALWPAHYIAIATLVGTAAMLLRPRG